MPPPPPYIPPDPSLQTHDSQSYVVIVTQVVCLVIATCFVAARLYTRRFILNQVWIDDYFAIASWVVLLALGINECVETRLGLGHRTYDVLASTGLVEFGKMMWIGLFLYNMGLLATKLTFFFQYYRLVRQITTLRRVYIGIMALVVVWTIAQIVIVLTACLPIASNWDPNIEGSCTIPPQIQFLMNSIGNIVTDVIILVLPLPVVWRLELRRPQKLMLIGIFCLGFFTCIIASLRLITIKPPDDLTWDAVTTSCWLTGELTSGLVCASIPALKPLMSYWFPSIFGTRANRSTKGYQTYQSSNHAKYAPPKSASREPLSEGDGFPNKSHDDNEIWALKDLETRRDITPIV